MTQSRHDRPAVQPTGFPVGQGRPTGQVVVASYSRYADAERAVDFLSDQGFPVEHTAIVGRGLTTVEQVTGRLNWWRAGLQSAATGAIIGALFGWLFGLFNWVNPLISSLLLALYGALIGAVLGLLLGMLSHSLTGGRRDFSSISGLQASSYDVLVNAELSDRAAALLTMAGGPGRGSYISPQ